MSRIPLAPKRIYSLWTETVVGLAVMATVAILIAIINALLFDRVVGKSYGTVLLGVILLADVAVFVLFGAFKLRSLVIEPLERTVAATQAIVAGDLTRRVPAGSTTEFARLSQAVNVMTGRLLEDQAQQAQLEKMAGMGQLAAGVAHEIGNPVAAINGYVHLIGARADGDADLRGALEGIERETSRIDRIVRGMLEYARPRRAAPVAVDVNTAVTCAIETLRSQGALRAVELGLELEPSAPRLRGDPHELEQVVVNLLLNAVSAMEGKGRVNVVTQRVPFTTVLKEGEGARRSDDPKGFAVQRNPNARLRAWLGRVGTPADILKVVVADSGPGIPWSESERVFDPFYTTKPAGTGTGLGLAIVARTVESLAGAVWVRPAREGGAAFVMLFPIPEEFEPAAATPGGSASERAT